MTEIDWTLLGRYAADDCTAEESERVQRYLVHFSEYRAGLEAIRRVAVGARQSTSVEERVTHLARLRQRIAMGSVVSTLPAPATTRLPAPQPQSGRFLRYVKIAAVALLAVSAALAAYRLVRHPAAPTRSMAATAHTITTVRGERMSLRLVDGTLVVLGTESKLQVSATYNTGQRSVTLEGEAEFTIAHGPRPFVVTTKRLVARDLGTHFVVRAYAGDSVADVVVVEGQVAVSHDSAGPVSPFEHAVLGRGQRARITARGQMAITDSVDLEPYVAWQADRVVFRGTPLEVVVSQIERWRNIQIDLVPPAASRAGPFVGVVGVQTPVLDVVRTIALIYGLEAEEIGPRHFALHVP